MSAVVGPDAKGIDYVTEDATARPAVILRSNKVSGNGHKGCPIRDVRRYGSADPSTQATFQSRPLAGWRE
jgi:hypothetical protein